MTQREVILRMLKRAGSEGVRSDAFFEAHLPRAAARILELKDEGHEITTEREGKFVRYRIVGGSAESPPSKESAPALSALPDPAGTPRPSAASSEAVKRNVPSMFDADVDWN